MSSSFATPWTVACQSPLSMGFPRKEYWSGLPFPSSGALPNPGIEWVSPPLSQSSLVNPWVYIYVYIYNLAFSNLRHQGPGTQMVSAGVTSDSSPSLPAHPEPQASSSILAHSALPTSQLYLLSLCNSPYVLLYQSFSDTLVTLSFV